MIYDVVVIGAGPSGIVSTKEMLERGFQDTLCLEKSDMQGGGFASGYDGLVLTSSALFSIFSDFPAKESEKHHHWTRGEALDYWRRYAEHFGVANKIRYNAEVVSLSHSRDYWTINLSDNEVIKSNRVIVAAGTNSVPRYPSWRDQVTDIQVVHARDYKNAFDLEGKRVVVVGGGEGGSDIALEVSRVASQCWVSLRDGTGWVTPRKRNGYAADISTHRGFWMLPREFGAEVSDAIRMHDRAQGDALHSAIADLNDRVPAKKGIWGTYGTKSVSLPQAMVEHDCKIIDGVSEVKDGGQTLITNTGVKLNNIDAIIFCTGYINRVPFLPIEDQVGSPRELYKHVFHHKYGASIGFVGFARPGFGSQFPLMEMQARFCGHVFNGNIALPSSEDMQETAKKDSDHYLEQFEGNTKQISALVDYHHYMDDIARTMGCTPRFWTYFFLRPRLWFHVVYGPTQATQFRLNGLGRKFDLSRKMLLAMPVSRFNHIVKIGLKLRFKIFVSQLLNPKKLTKRFIGRENHQ